MTNIQYGIDLPFPHTIYVQMLAKPTSRQFYELATLSLIFLLCCLTAVTLGQL